MCIYGHHIHFKCPARRGRLITENWSYKCRYVAAGNKTKFTSAPNNWPLSPAPISLLLIEAKKVQPRSLERQ